MDEQELRGLLGVDCNDVGVDDVTEVGVYCASKGVEGAEWDIGGNWNN